MIKNKFLILAICLSNCISIPGLAKQERINLIVSGIDDSPTMPDRSKAPIRMPQIYHDGNVLLLSEHHPEYLINIIQDGEVVFSALIPIGVTTFMLPSDLSGECTIQFLAGELCYTGIIML